MTSSYESKFKKALCVLSAVVLSSSFSSCSGAKQGRPSAPETSSLVDIEPFSEYPDNVNIKINDEFTLKYSDYNYAQSDSSQVDVLADRCVRILSYGKSDDGVLEVVVKNEGDEDIKYAVLKCTSDSGEKSFKITVLPKGAVCVLTEDNGAIFDEKESFYGFELSDKVVFDNEMSSYPDVFYLRGRDGKISVKNISDHDVSNVTVYYKNEENGVFVGNETYRVQFGDIASNEEKELEAPHFNAYTGRVMFIEYDS